MDCDSSCGVRQGPIHDGLSPPRTLLLKKEPASDFGFLFGLVDFHQIVGQLGPEFNSTLQRVARIGHHCQKPAFIFFLALCLKAATVEFFQSAQQVRR